MCILLYRLVAVCLLIWAGHAHAFSITLNWDNYTSQFSPSTNDTHNFFVIFQQEDTGSFFNIATLFDLQQNTTSYIAVVVDNPNSHTFCYYIQAGAGLILPDGCVTNSCVQGISPMAVISPASSVVCTQNQLKLSTVLGVVIGAIQ